MSFINSGSRKGTKNNSHRRRGRICIYNKQMFSFNPYSSLYTKAFSLNLHFPLVVFSFLKRQSKRSGLVFLLLGCVFQTNSTGAKTLDECRELWKTPQEIKSCVLLRGVSEKSRYQEVLKTPNRPYGYQSFKFGTLREKLLDGQTHLILSVELMVTHPAFQYLSLIHI